MVRAVDDALRAALLCRNTLWRRDGSGGGGGAGFSTLATEGLIEEAEGDEES